MCVCLRHWSVCVCAVCWCKAGSHNISDKIRVDGYTVGLAYKLTHLHTHTHTECCMEYTCDVTVWPALSILQHNPTTYTSLSASSTSCFLSRYDQLLWVCIMFKHENIFTEQLSPFWLTVAEGGNADLKLSSAIFTTAATLNHTPQSFLTLRSLKK